VTSLTELRASKYARSPPMGRYAMPPSKKRSGGKRATKKTAAKPGIGHNKPLRAAKKKSAKPGIGHNKPPTSEVPPISSWQFIDESTGRIARGAADRQRRFIAASSGMVAPVGPPSLFAGDPSALHAEMLKRIAALEETIAKLTSAAGDQIEQRALRIEEVKNELNTLKTQSPVPEKPPTEATAAQSKLKQIAEIIVAVKAASDLYQTYHDQIIALVQIIGEWIARLPPGTMR
jgi:hypothetical protein